VIDTLDYAISSLRRAASVGYPWSVSPDEAIALVAEVERLRADLDALSRVVGQACVAATLAAGETLAEPSPHIIVSMVTRLRAEALGQRAEVAYLRACVPPLDPRDYGHEVWAESYREAQERQRQEERAAVVAWLNDAADTRYRDCCCGPIAACADAIERGEHRREEE
jgi:hypothetical protein